MISNYHSKIIALLLSIRLETTPLAIATVYIGGLIAGASFNSIPLLFAVVVSFFITAGSMTFNDAFDWKVDAVNHPNRPIPKGILTAKQMFSFTAGLFLAALVISFFINLLCTIIVLGSIGVLFFYERYSKQYGIIGNLTVALISSVAFTFGGAAVENPLASLPLTLLAFLIIFGREIIMDIRDAEGDKKLRVTLPHQVGVRDASVIGSSILSLAVLLSPLPYILQLVSVWYLYFIIPVDILMVATIVWLLYDSRNAGVSAHIIRGALAIGLVGFLVGILY